MGRFIYVQLVKASTFLFCWWALMGLWDLLVASGFFALIAWLFLMYFFVRAIAGMFMDG